MRRGGGICPFGLSGKEGGRVVREGCEGCRLCVVVESLCVCDTQLWPVHLTHLPSLLSPLLTSKRACVTGPSRVLCQSNFPASSSWRAWVKERSRRQQAGRRRKEGRSKEGRRMMMAEAGVRRWCCWLLVLLLCLSKPPRSSYVTCICVVGPCEGSVCGCQVRCVV